jgi:RHS repeat-associated protein
VAAASLTVRPSDRLTVLVAASLLALPVLAPHPAVLPAGAGSALYPTTVTPGEAPVTHESNTTQQAVFTVWNSGGTAKNGITLTCGATGAVTCLSVSPATLNLPAWSEEEVTVTFKAGTGTLTLSASTGGQGSYLVNGIAGTAPIVTLVVPTLTSGSRAVVRNRQPVIRALITNGSTVDTAQTLLIWRGDTVTMKARHNRRLIEWEVDSTRWLGVGDSAQVQVKACSYGQACQDVFRWVVLPNDSVPVLGFSGIPLEALGAGFSSPFGPGLAVSGAEIETGFATVPYVSMGAARSAGLVYSTRQSYPRALIPVDIELPWPTGTPTSLKVVPVDGSTRMDSVVIASPSCATGAVKRCRTVLQPDFASGSFSTPTRKWIKLEVTVTSGGVSKAGVDSVEVVLVDRRTTPYGSGWWPSAGIQVVAAGSDRVLVGPSGTASVYRGNGDSSYIAPPGTFSTLTRVGSTWELTSRGSLGKSIFDSQGRLVTSVDAHGNRDSVFYNGSVATQVDSLKDPKGKKISFTYTSGKLSKITSLTGTAARETKITVDGSGRLVYDSLSSPTGKAATTSYVYQSYPGTGTVMLLKRIGVLLDTTIVTYDSTFKRRPVSVRLPRVENENNSIVTPVISYVAMEKQGYGSLRSLDSVYVEMKDPRSFWTRSLLNRWGQARKSWDSLGVLSRAQFDNDGFVQWTEGKVADSSRSYTVYDSQRRPVKSYIVRASGDTLRGDSVVYDANHWVIKRVDNRGKQWLTSYTATGKVATTITPTGDTTTYSYNANGTLWQMRLPGNQSYEFQQFTYDATWGNLSQHDGELGTLLVKKTYDRYGRDSIVENKVPVKSVGTNPEWQWRRTVLFLNAANQADSVHTQRSDNCTHPCNAGSYLYTDTLHLMPVRHVYDRAGRDSLRINERGTATRYLYDRLGRLRVRQPWTDSSEVLDSMFYDIAGNLKKSRSRRANVITLDYDSRNRDTLSTIPGVGTIRKSYGGPGDQLTRMWNAAPVDSIGNVNGEVRFGYDQRGRLKADTSYTASVARATTYTYDTWERPVTLVDPQGTWTNRYETERGLPDTLITPYADTVLYIYDTKGRAIGPTIKFGQASSNLITTQKYLVNGALDSVTQTLGTEVQSQWARKAGGGEHGPALRPSFTDVLGRVWQDSLQYDGWERAALWVAKADGDPTGLRDTMLFDRAGNVNIQAVTALTVEPTTNRLTMYKKNGHYYGYSYDRAGNLTGFLDSVMGQAGPVTWVYGYDGLERLVSVRRSGTVIARYGYDVLGRRIAKRVYSSASGGTVAYTRFVYHGDQVAFETDSSGTLGLRYTWGPGTDNLLAVRNASGTIHAYAVPDRLGSVRGLVKRDGTVIYAFTYRPYGEPADSAGSGGLELRYRWTGREYDAETGWYFHRARYYDPTARRFVQEDPIGYAGGRNVYAYVDGRVMEATDPSGLHAEASTLRKHRPDVPLVSLGEWVNREMDALFGGSFGGLSTKAVYSEDGQWLGNVGCTALLGCDYSQATDALVMAQCMQNPVCRDAKETLDALGVRWGREYRALADFEPAESQGGTPPHSNNYGTYIDVSNFEEASRRYVGGIPVDGAMVLAHEMGHIIIWQLNNLSGGLFDEAASDAAAVALENRARNWYPSHYRQRRSHEPYSAPGFRP